MPLPASEVEITLAKDWVRKGMSRPRFWTTKGFCCLMATTMLLRLLRLLPRFTALTMAASTDSISVAVSPCDIVGWGVAAGLLASDCCAKRLWNANPSTRQDRRSNGCFFMDEWFFHPEHCRWGGDISLRRHYPDQVGGYNLSAQVEAPRMMPQR